MEMKSLKYEIVAVSAVCAFVFANEPERGKVDVDEPIPANTLRLYKYTRRR